MKYFFTIFLVGFCLFGYSQEKKDELTIHKINGKEYYIHVVDSGNTLFAISRKYAIPREEILKANPRLTDVLTLGDRLMIPLDKIKAKDLNDAPEIDGNFLIHEVQKKNTLYSLAKEYNIEINDILVQNPEVENGLKKGMKLRIPVAKIKSESANQEYVIPAVSSPYITHMVKAKETMYQLSKLYKVSVDSILLVNNSLVGGLREGELINIPILKNYKSIVVDTTRYDSSAIKKSYKVTLLLPFYLDLFDIANASGYTQSKKLNEELYGKSRYGIEFYQGFKLAAEEWSEKGLNLELKVLDTGNDSANVVKLLKNENIDQSDLIIGPLFLDNFLMVADFAKKNKINIISPVKLSNKILLGNGYVSKVATSEPVLTKFIGQYIHDSLRFKNILMIFPNQVQERRRVELIKKHFTDFSQKEEDTSRISPIREVYWNPKDLWGIKSKLVKGKENVIIVPSEDQAFVVRLLTVLSGMEEYTFKVIGMAAWENYENIEISYLHHLNVHLIVSEYVNDESDLNHEFRSKYFTTYEIIPEKFSYLGYDVGNFYLSFLMKHGTNFSACLDQFKLEGLGRKFNYKKTGFESGFENHSTYIFKYNNYKKQKVY